MGKEKKRLNNVNPLQILQVAGKRSLYFLNLNTGIYIRHNLDVMHIEKNACESIIGTVLNIPGKTRDGVKSRLDLLEMGLRPNLAPRFGLKQTYLPPSCYTLSRKEKKK